MHAQNSATPDVPPDLMLVRPDVLSHGLLCSFNTFEVFATPKAKPFQVRFWLECNPLTLQRARPLFHKSLAPQKPNQFKQGSRWNAFRGHCKVPAKIPVAKRYVKQHATALFRATCFPLKRPFQSQSVKERSVILSNIAIAFISFDRVAGSSVGQKNPYYCGLLCDRK